MFQHTGSSSVGPTDLYSSEDDTQGQKVQEELIKSAEATFLKVEGQLNKRSSTKLKQTQKNPWYSMEHSGVKTARAIEVLSCAKCTHTFYQVVEGDVIFFSTYRLR